MAYRFSGGDYVDFSIAPLAGYTSGNITFAVLFKRNVVSAYHCLVGFGDGGGSGKGFWRINNSDQQEVALAGSATVLSPLLSSTGGPYLAVLTKTGTQPRGHLHDGSSWTHSDADSVVAPISFVGTDEFRVGKTITGGSPLSADVVCIGIKKADSTDSQVATLSPTDFSTWTAFGFDWLIRFDGSSARQDQASPGTGDEIARGGTSLVADPPGWSWGGAPAFVPQIVIT